MVAFHRKVAVTFLHALWRLLRFYKQIKTKQRPDDSLTSVSGCTGTTGGHVVAVQWQVGGRKAAVQYLTDRRVSKIPNTI